jgi:predicted metalloprotease
MTEFEDEAGHPGDQHTDPGAEPQLPASALDAEHAVWATPAYAVEDMSRPVPKSLKALIGVLVALLVLVVAGASSGGVEQTVAGQAAATPADPSSAAPGEASSPKPAARVHALDTNPLLAKGVTLSPVTCELPHLGRAPAELTAFYQAEMKCLDEMWNPALVGVHEPTFSSLLAVSVPAHSACGKAPDSKEALAYYCAGDLTIYAPSDWMLAAVGLNKASHLATIAHEYGHHVQNESGILDAAEDETSSPGGDSPADLEISRRIELQANCFGALFIADAAGRGAISTSLANATIADYGNTDDSDTHGSRKHQLGWAKTGFAGKTPASCNTWSASPDEVS